MRAKAIWVILCLMLILALVFSCTTKTTTSTSTAPTTPKTTATSTAPGPAPTTSAPGTTPTSPAPGTTTAPGATTATQPTTWWEKKWGEPVYGGTLTYCYAFVDVICDPAQDPRPSQFGAHMEWLTCDNMLTDRSEYSFRGSWTPMKYLQGWLAESWEQTDPTTVTIKLRKGIKWHNRPPTNGREFDANDVVFMYDRALGTGNGFTEPNPFFAPQMTLIKKAVAVDKYTVQVQLKNPSPFGIYQAIEPYLRPGFTAPEWWALSDQQKQDFRYVVGTGAFILTDFQPGTSITYDKNPDYWGYDERYPNNKLPYLDHWKVLAIPDLATQVAALRTAKVDMIVDGRSHVTADQAMSLAKTNPEIQCLYWVSGAGSVTFRYGAKPFDDIRIRKAMQMCIDTTSIAKDYYRGLGDPTPVSFASPLLGSDWADPYESWPESLQKEYQYNVVEARKLMAAAGYPNGFKTQMLVSAQDDTQLAQVIKAYFMEIGIDCEIEVKDPVTAGYMTRGNQYTQMVFGGGAGVGPPYDGITNFWSQKSERQGGVIDAHYDELVDKFYKATTEAEAQKIFKEAARYSIEQHWQLNLGTVKTAQVFQSWIKGWDGENFWSTPQWAYYARMWIKK